MNKSLALQTLDDVGKSVQPNSFALERLALAASEVAELLGISERHVWSLHSAGLVPRPVSLGRSKRWPIDELRAWLAAGSPSRDNWEASRNGGAA
jgi:predicted DNA-binding transcriptional regulator AlpA